MLRNKLFFILILIFTSTTFANDITTQIQRILDREHSKAHVGIYVQSLRSGKVYFSKAADQNFAPASVQKLFTVTAALINLKPDFIFHTNMLSTGAIQSGVLNGNIIFQFTGDPTITESDLRRLIATLHSKNVREITGNLVIDDTAYKTLPYPPGWIWDDLSYDYAAPLNTVIIDRNRFGITFKPASSNGAAPTVIAQLPKNTAIFFNTIKTEKYCPEDEPLTIYSDNENHYWVSGCLSRELGEQSRTLAIRDMKLFTDGLIRGLFAAEHIQFHGRVFYQHAPGNATVLANITSAPLHQLIIHLMKKSDNLYADTLLKKMGQLYVNGPGGWQDGLKAVEKVMYHKVGILKEDIHLNDGAGLSRYDFVTPRALGQLLTYIAGHDDVKPYMMKALPIAGVDGTLAGRMPNLAKDHAVHAKTGSMTGVSSLAGFVKTKTHGTMAFVILVNNFSGKLTPYRALENRIVEVLAKS